MLQQPGVVVAPVLRFVGRDDGQAPGLFRVREFDFEHGALDAVHRRPFHEALLDQGVDVLRLAGDALPGLARLEELDLLQGDVLDAGDVATGETVRAGHQRSKGVFGRAGKEALVAKEVDAECLAELLQLALAATIDADFPRRLVIDQNVMLLRAVENAAAVGAVHRALALAGQAVADQEPAFAVLGVGEDTATAPALLLGIPIVKAGLERRQWRLVRRREGWDRAGLGLEIEEGPGAGELVPVVDLLEEVFVLEPGLHGHVNRGGLVADVQVKVALLRHFQDGIHAELVSHLVDEVERVHQVGGHVGFRVNEDAGKGVEVERAIVGDGGDSHAAPAKVGSGGLQPFNQGFTFDSAQGVRV